MVAFAGRCGLLTRQYKSTDIAQFQAFLNNRFEQFFVWSDLMNFSTSALFNFTFDASGPMTINSMKNKNPGVQWTLSAPTDVEMDAVMSNGVVPYTEFQSNTPTGVSLLAQAKSGALNITYSVTNLDIGLDIEM